MIVTEFQIDRFRDGQPLRVLDLGNGLNVAFVEDRLAQRMMLDIVPAVLYGETVFHRGPRRANGRGTSSLPATVAVRTDNGVFRIRRVRTKRGATGSEVSIKSPDGTQHEATFLRTLVDDVSQKRFERLFTLNTSRLGQEIRTKRAQVVRDLEKLAVVLRDAAPEIEGEPLPKVSTKPLRAVEGSLTELASSLADAAKQDQERKKREAAAVEVRDLGGIVGEIERLEHEIAAAERHRAQVEEEFAETQAALNLSRMRVQLDQLERDLARLQEPVSAVVGKGSSKSKSNRSIEELSERLARCRQRRVELSEERKGLRGQIAEVARQSRVSTLLPRIEASLLQEKFLLTEEQAIERLADHVRELELRLDNSRMISQSRQSEISHQQTLASQALAELDRYADQFRRTRREYLEVRERLAQIPRNQATQKPVVESPAAALLDAMVDEPMVEEPEDLETRSTPQDLSRERGRINQRLADLQADRAALDDVLQRMYAEQLVPFRVLLWLGVPFMAGVAMIIYGMFMAASDTSWRFVGFGFAFSIATAFVKMSLDHLNGGRLEETRRQVEEVDREISELMSRADRLTERSDTAHESRKDDGGVGELATARRGKGRGARRAALAAKVDTTARIEADNLVGRKPNAEWSRLRAQAAELRRRYREMIKRWRDFLLALELSPALSPSQAKEALEHRVASPADSQEAPDRTLEFQLKQLRNDLERRRAALAQTVSNVRSVAQELGFSLNGTTMVEQLNILRESLHDYHERVKSQRELRGLLKQVQSRAARLKAYDRKLSHERRQLRSTERKSARELALRRQLMDEKGKLLNRERAELVDRINVQRQRLETRPAALALIDLSPGELDSRLDNLSTQLNALQDELPVKYELRGTLRQQKREAEQQAKPRSKGTTPWPDLIAKADEVTKTWQKVTEHTDAQVAALRRHQRPTVGPRHLQVAGDYLRRLTDGRWSQVTLIGEPASLQVGHAQGSSVGVMELPEKELFDLLFSLWLAQLDMLAEQRVKLPIILEDPLGMTSHSPLAAAKVLRDFAATGHQLILTTSQPEHAEWFADLEVPIANFAIRRATTGRASRKSEMDDPAQHRRTRRKKGRETPTIPPEDEAGDTVNDPWGNAISSLG